MPIWYFNSSFSAELPKIKRNKFNPYFNRPAKVGKTAMYYNQYNGNIPRLTITMPFQFTDIFNKTYN